MIKSHDPYAVYKRNKLIAWIKKIKGNIICKKFHKPVFVGFPTAGRMLFYPYRCYKCNNQWLKIVKNTKEESEKHDAGLATIDQLRAAGFDTIRKEGE